MKSAVANIPQIQNTRSDVKCAIPEEKVNQYVRQIIYTRDTLTLLLLILQMAQQFNAIIANKFYVDSERSISGTNSVYSFSSLRN